MRKPRHFSPTSFSLWENDREQYYTQYLAESRTVREPQTMPMAIGSAFDFIVKERLYQSLPAGKISSIPSEMKAGISSQVEEHNLPEAAEHGERVMDAYVKCGAFAALCAEIVRDARFEFGLTGVFASGTLIDNRRADGDMRLCLNGRPDGHYVTRARHDSKDVPVVHDWKVNGWLSATKSPDPGYICVHKHDGSVGEQHKDAFVSFYEGIKVNKATNAGESWRAQLAIYGWLLGVPVGDTILGSIDQVIGPQDKPRVAKQRFIISKEFQLDLYKRLEEAWEIVNSDWIFRDLSPDASRERCAALEAAPSDDWENSFRER